MGSVAGPGGLNSIAVNPIGESDRVLLRRATLKGWAEFRPAKGKPKPWPRVRDRAREEERARQTSDWEVPTYHPEGLSAQRVLGGLWHGLSL